MEAETILLAESRELSVTDLFRAHHLELVRLAVMMTGDLGTAEDVVQDVYERLHRSCPVLYNSASGLAYARASVLNGCRSANRRAAVRRKHAARLFGGELVTADAESATANRGALAEALRALPQRQREVLVLRYFCDLDVAELGPIDGVEGAGYAGRPSWGGSAMSRFERKLRQDMAELARQLAPGDLRPLRPPSLAELAGSPVMLGPSARSARRPGQWLGPMAAMLAVALVAGGLLAARNVLHAHAAAGMPAAERVPADPPVVAITGMSASGRSAAIRITSVKAGRTVRSLPIASDGNGLALAPDAKSLYVVGSALRISQVSVVSGASKSLGAGAYPAVSPDSATLAYASGDDFSAVAVRSLRSDYVRSISLRPLIGAGSSLLNQGGLTWLGNGLQVVAVPEPDPVAISGGGLAVSSGSGPRTGSASGSVRPARRTACGQQNSPHGLCVIVVDVRPRALQARKVFVPYVVQAGPLDALSGDLTTASSFVMVQSTKGGDVVNEVTLGQPAVTVRRLVTLPFQALAVGIAPRADRVLYVPEKSPIGVWIGVMSHGRLTRTRRLLSDVAGFEFAQAAW